MRSNRNRLLTISLSIFLLLGAASATTPPKARHHSGKAAKTSKHHSSRRVSRHKTARNRGQQAMDPSRVREIQAALIREHYLTGQPDGTWDQRSKDAMQKYQADNGWQTKLMPDSRALIKLGLGPDNANLINPDTAAVSFIPGGGSNSAQR